jgi:cardiolipin synthase
VDVIDKKTRKNRIYKVLKKILRILTGRAVIFGLSLLIQIAWLTFTFFKLTSYSTVISVGLSILSLVVVAYIINSHGSPSVKLPWIVLILTLPVFGGLLYLLVGGKRPQRKMRKKLAVADGLTAPYVEDHTAELEEIRQEDPYLAGQMSYIASFGYPVYKNTRATYFTLGDENYPVILEELKKAEHYIFLEYFIVQEGKMWDSILEVLKEKAAAGVDVRFMYDDMGCLLKLPSGYYKQMEEYGIHCQCFNPFVPFLSVIMNNRDHRKILVIDGHTAFTGGINLADEYININSRFGHWKDAGVMLQGEAVWSLTLMFLNMWNGFRPTDTNLEVFKPHVWQPEPFPGEGYVQPYADTPLDREIMAENVYMNLINGATRYVYIYTPYLITDHEMTTCLCLAAKRGVDVRIITPGIPDKKMVYHLTRAHYPELLDNGVKIYEYTPGFVHAKCVVVDDRLATVGTVNFDYRSLYLHFECGTLHYNNTVVSEVKADFLETQKKCRQVTEYSKAHTSFMKEIYFAILRLLAPLM